MGLGAYSAVSLAVARKLADRWRAVAAEGRDPVKVREAEATDAPQEVADACLAPLGDGSVVRASRRTDDRDQRRALMERWAAQVTGAGAAASIRRAPSRVISVSGSSRAPGWSKRGDAIVVPDVSPLREGLASLTARHDTPPSQAPSPVFEHSFPHAGAGHAPGLRGEGAEQIARGPWR